MRRMHWTAAAVFGLVGAAITVEGLRHPAQAHDAKPQDARAEEPKPPAAAAREGGKRTVRLYDLTDLVRPIGDHEFPDRISPPARIQARERWMVSTGLFGGGEPQRPPGEPAPVEMKDIAQLIEADLALAGDENVPMRILGNTLAIAQTDESHARTQRFLAAMREVTRPVHVDAFWLILAPDDVARLLKDPKPAAAAGAEVDAAALAAITDRRLHARGAVSCVSGQRVQLLAGRVRTVVIDQTSLVGTGATAYDPEVENLLAGTTLQIRPMLADGKARVDVVVSGGDWTEPAPPVRVAHHQAVYAPATQPTDLSVSGRYEADAVIDRVNMSIHHLATTVRLPLGRPTLIGGMTVEPSAGERKAADAQLYLILRVAGEEAP